VRGSALVAPTAGDVTGAAAVAIARLCVLDHHQVTDGQGRDPQSPGTLVVPILKAVGASHHGVAHQLPAAGTGDLAEVVSETRADFPGLPAAVLYSESRTRDNEVGVPRLPRSSATADRDADVGRRGVHTARHGGLETTSFCLKRGERLTWRNGQPRLP
jgi:hypothetical protein